MSMAYSQKGSVSLDPVVGLAAKPLKPKFNFFVRQVSVGCAAHRYQDCHCRHHLPKAFGGLLFIISSSFGAFLLLVMSCLCALDLKAGFRRRPRRVGARPKAHCRDLDTTGT